MLRLLKAILPEPIVALFRAPYHFALQWIAAAQNGFPGRSMVVIGVTGTKGKSTVADMLYAILVAAEYKTALASTIRFVTPRAEEANRFKMTMQGRGFIQHLLGRARREGATHAVVEVTSEGARQYRHKFLYLDALVVTNIQKEHIESHGSFENYVAAKRSIVAELERSPKKDKLLVINESAAALHSASVPMSTYGDTDISTAPTVPLSGEFNRLNALAALRVAMHLGIAEEVARKALAELPPVKGRVERIDEGQNFVAVVDYAHTPDSLQALYGAFPQKKICVLGNTGGGRDKWKRPEMGAIADRMCETVILTNEDPYDEDPEAIVKEMAAGMNRAPKIILDRREAIATALQLAKPGDAVLISGKGTDPYIMGAKGSKDPWSDAQVVREELKKLV